MRIFSWTEVVGATEGSFLLVSRQHSGGRLWLIEKLGVGLKVVAGRHEDDHARTYWVCSGDGGLVVPTDSKDWTAIGQIVAEIAIHDDSIGPGDALALFARSRTSCSVT